MLPHLEFYRNLLEEDMRGRWYEGLVSTFLFAAMDTDQMARQAMARLKQISGLTVAEKDWLLYLICSDNLIAIQTVLRSEVDKQVEDCRSFLRKQRKGKLF